MTVPTPEILLQIAASGNSQPLASRAVASRFLIASALDLLASVQGYVVGLGMGKSDENTKFVRPGWDEYFMEIAHVVKRRSNCARRTVAAIIVKDKRIISTGYNGTPRGIKNCCDGGCPRCNSDAPSGTDLGNCICSHAEENSIVQAAYHGISVKGSAIYVTLSPCLTCAKMIINAGIVEVIYDEEYAFNDQTKNLFGEAGVRFRRLT